MIRDCNKCGVVANTLKEAQELFYVKFKDLEPTMRSHWNEVCKVCAKIYKYKYYKDNKDYINKKRSDHYYKNKEFYREKNLKRTERKTKDINKLLQIRKIRVMSDEERFWYDKYNGWEKQAIRRGIEYSITDKDIEFLWKKQNGKCFYTNIELKIEKNDLFTVSLDRINSKLGYIKGNVALCGNIINLMKLDLTIEEFKQIVLYLSTGPIFNINS
jgi:hypothetical protein